MIRMGEWLSCFCKFLQRFDGIDEQSFARGVEKGVCGRLRCQKTVGAGMKGFVEVFLVVLFEKLADALPGLKGKFTPARGEAGL